MYTNELYKKTISGERSAERKLFAYLTVSFRLIAQHRIRYRLDVEDVVQDALKTIAEKYRSINFETSFDAWAQKVLGNKILDYYKAKGVERRNIVPEIEGVEMSKSWMPNPSLKMKLLDCLRRINGIHSRHARILNLRHQGYGTDEICQKMKISANNFYVMLSRARLLLETCLEEGDIR